MPTATKTSKADALQLQRYEDILQTAQTWDLERAKALAAIEGEQLWRAARTKKGRLYESFVAYALDKWDIEHSQTYRLTGWARLLETLELSPDRGKLPTEWATRPLQGYAPDKQRQLWSIACRRGSPPTASTIAKVVEDDLRSRSRQKPSETPLLGTGSVIRGDATKVLATLDDDSVDLVLTSPPYGLQRQHDYPSIPESKYPSWTVTWMASLRPKLKSSGSVLLNIRESQKEGQIGDYVLRTRLALREAGWIEIETLIWVKPDSMPTGSMNRPRRSWEYIFWFAKTNRPWVDMKACGGELVESRSRMARPRHIKTEHMGKQPFCRFNSLSKRVTDVVYAATGSSSRGIAHPTAYSLALCDQLVQTYSPLNGLIVDPFSGSGTTLLSARNNGRRYFGIDLVGRYVKLARKRLAAPPK